MTDRDYVDIVTMLRAPDRLEPHLCAAAANKIERLRSVVEAWLKYSQRAERDIETLRAEIERMQAVLRSIAAMEHQEPACAAYAKDALNGLPVPTEPSGGECAALRDQLAAMTRQRDNLKATLDRRIAEDLERDLYAGEG